MIYIVWILAKIRYLRGELALTQGYRTYGFVNVNVFDIIINLFILILNAHLYTCWDQDSVQSSTMLRCKEFFIVVVFGM